LSGKHEVLDLFPSTTNREDKRGEKRICVFEVSMGYTVRPCFKKKKKDKL
jgi:hypothetical protein